MSRDNRERLNLEIGDVVMSTAGRGSGRYYLVIEVKDAEYVLISDGDTRKMSRPKRKKNLHLALISHCDYSISSLSDSKIREIIKNNIL